MQSNTVEIESRPANFPSLSVEKRTYKPDPFTIKDGHYVGSDRFVVPRDFDEFYQRFPDYVRNWVSKHVRTSAPKEDVEDWTHDLLIGWGGAECHQRANWWAEDLRKNVPSTGSERFSAWDS